MFHCCDYFECSGHSLCLGALVEVEAFFLIDAFAFVGIGSAAQLAAGDFVRHCMAAVFLLNGAYQPYYKWAFRAMRELPRLSLLAELMEYLLTTDNDAEMAAEKARVIEGVAAGCFVIAVNTGPLPDSALTGQGAHLLFHSMTELSQHIKDVIYASNHPDL